MKPSPHAVVSLGITFLLGMFPSPETRLLAADHVVNLASSAQITATSEYSGDYLAQGVADGEIPLPKRQADAGKAWCVKGDTHRQGAELSFHWPQPVTVAEVVYYSRTAWFFSEGWKDYALFANGHPEAIAQGQFLCGHGAQRLQLPEPVQTDLLVLRFTSSFGGPNPGAAEVQVFAQPPGVDQLLAFTPASPEGQETNKTPSSTVPESPALAQALHQGQLGFSEIVAVERQRIDPTHVYTYHAEGLRPGGGLNRISLAPGEPAERRKHRLVDAGPGIILDCALAPDGRRVLFSWKRSMDDAFQLYVINIDGTGLRQVTEDPSNNMNPCWLPNGDIAFLSDRKPAFAYCWVTTSPVLYRCQPDGSNVIRLSANYLNDFTPSVLSDGRILYSRWEYVDRPAIPIQSLWTMHPDGTGLAGFFGNRVLSPATFMEAREIPGTREILCVLTSHNGPCRGAIGIIDPRRGANAQDAIRNLTPEIQIGQVDLGDGNRIRGPYESPFPLDPDFFLVSRDGTVLLRDYAGTQQVTLLEAKSPFGHYSPQPIRQTAPPAHRPSLLPDHVKGDWATVLLEDVTYGLEPHVRRGEITQIAVVQEMEKSRFADKEYRAFGFQFPVVSCGATYAPKKVWGYADVAPDGSAHFQVPSGVPIYFLALDASGRAVQRMRTFAHFMPGEQQSCLGCHADRNQAAPGRATPPLAARQAPQSLTPPEWGVRGFSYAHIVQPVLDQHCVQCHNALQKDGEVDLSGDHTDIFCVSYETLARAGTGATRPDVGGYAPRDFGENPYTRWIATYNGMEANILEITPKHWGSPASLLAHIVASGHVDDQGQPRVSLSPEEQRRIYAWIDLNVPYYGTSESNHYEVKGCRQLLPSDLDQVLAEVAQRRCATCHDQGLVPRPFYTRITNVEHNDFLLAPLSRSAGGTEACGQAVFLNRADPDYQALLKTFAPLKETLRERPRMDML